MWNSLNFSPGASCASLNRADSGNSALGHVANVAPGAMLPGAWSRRRATLRWEFDTHSGFRITSAPVEPAAIAVGDLSWS